MAFISYEARSIGTVTVCIGGLDRNYSRDDREIEWTIIDNSTDDFWFETQTDIAAEVRYSDDYVIYGLTPGTEYTIRADIMYYDADEREYLWKEVEEIIVETYPVYDPTLYLDYLTPNKISVYTTPSDIFDPNDENDYEIEVQWRLATQSWTDLDTKTSHTFTGLDPETRYRIRVRISCSIDNVWLWDTDYTQEYFTTYPEPWLNDLEITENSLTINVEEVEDYYDSYTITWYQDGVHLSSSSSRTSYTFDELDAGTDYTISVLVNCEDGIYTISLGTVFTTLDKEERPPYFNWTDYDGQTKPVRNATFIVMADAWNGLTNNINEVRIYYNHDEYAFTTAYPGRDFKATMYNQAVEAIQEIDNGDYGYYLSTVESGDSITAKLLNDLVSELNVIP